MILNAFLTDLRNAIYGDSFTAASHIAIGTGTTAVTASDTALETEVYPDGANRSAISSRTKPTDASVRQQMLITVGQANGESIMEIGASNAATGGTFQNRIVLPTAVAKTAAYQLKVQVQTTVSNVA